jgi:hypothetical protein
VVARYVSDRQVLQAYAEGASFSGEQTYERRIAGQAQGRTRLTSGQPVESWSDEAAYRGSFVQGAIPDSTPAQGRGDVPQRPGANNPRTLAPIPYLGPARNQPVVRQQAPDQGGRGVKNDASVTW